MQSWNSDGRVDALLAGLDASLEPLPVGPKAAWLQDRFRPPAQGSLPPWRPDIVLVVPAGRPRNRLRLELAARRLRARRR